MTRTCTWLLAVASLLGWAGTSRADLPALSPLVLPVLFGQESTPASSPAQATPVPYQRLEFGHPTIPVMQWAVPLSAAPASQSVLAKDQPKPSQDDDWLSDLFWDTVDSLIDFAPEARMIVQQLRPCTPYHLAAAAILEYLSAMDAAQRTAPVTSEAVPVGPACCKGGTCKSCEVPYPQPVCPYGCGGYIVGVGPGGPFAIPCSGGARVGVDFNINVPYCTKAGFGCGTHPSVPLDSIADACDNGECGQEVVESGAKSKACKCCEDCKDCKDCNCKKNTAVKSGNKAVYIQRIIMEPACSGLPMAMPPVPPPYPPFTFGFPLPPPGHPVMPPMPPDMRNLSPSGFGEWGVPPHVMMPPMPPSPLQDWRN